MSLFNPSPTSALEYLACRPWLEMEIEAVQPRVMVSLGTDLKLAAQYASARRAK
jgi:uracil-DNA glycosylase